MNGSDEAQHENTAQPTPPPSSKPNAGPTLVEEHALPWSMLRPSSPPAESPVPAESPALPAESPASPAPTTSAGEPVATAGATPSDSSE